MNIHVKKMDAEKLIGAVKRRNILYESSKKVTRTPAKKEEVWKEVAEEVGCDALYKHYYSYT